MSSVMVLVAAALAAEGEAELGGITYFGWGYTRMAEKLKVLGAEAESDDAGHCARTQSTDPRTHATIPRTHVTNPRTQSTDPRAHVTDPRPHVTIPRTQSTNPRTHVSNPRTHVTIPRTQSSNPRTHRTFCIPNRTILELKLYSALLQGKRFSLSNPSFRPRKGRI